MTDHLIPLADANLQLVTDEEPPKQSLYLAAGSPTRCQNDACKKQFDGCCIRGDDDRYYCSEECAQIGLEVDLDKFSNVVRLSAAT